MRACVRACVSLLRNLIWIFRKRPFVLDGGHVVIKVIRSSVLLDIGWKRSKEKERERENRRNTRGINYGGEDLRWRHVKNVNCSDWSCAILSQSKKTGRYASSPVSLDSTVMDWQWAMDCGLFDARCNKFTVASLTKSPCRLYLLVKYPLCTLSTWIHDKYLERKIWLPFKNWTCTNFYIFKVLHSECK